MLRWGSLDAVPTVRPPAVVSVGVFDGVHRGHQAILARARADAAAAGAETVVVTFDPHPDAVLRPERAPLMLTTVDDRLDLLAGLGVDATLVLPFSKAVSEWSPEAFVAGVLVGPLRALRVVVGENFRFGHRAAGDVALLRAIGETSGFDVDAVGIIGGGIIGGGVVGGGIVGGELPVSSTAIRELVAAGDVAGAAELLGRPHHVVGPVVRGDGRGRELGCPTANLSLPPGVAVPADGVYAGWMARRRDGQRWPSAISVGTNPTFDGTERRVEAHAIDVDVDLYDDELSVEFTHRLRDMVRFEGIDDLVAQMVRDVAEARALL